MMEKNFEKLEELIKDDDKIVTLPSFAYETGISIAESKEIIQKYAEINKGSKEINITYILNGRNKEKDQLSVSLIKKDNLEEEKELYEQGVNQIIFSIQKAQNLDFNVIALVDAINSVSEKDPLPGAIIGKNCTKRTLRKKVLPTLPPAKIRGKSTIFTKQNSTVKSESQKVERDGGDSNQNNKNKGTTQGNIASLFSKATQNKKTIEKDTKQPEKKPKTNGGLSNFLTKKPSSELKINEDVTKKKEIRAESMDIDDDILKDLEVKEETHSENKTKKEKEQVQANQSQKQDKKSDLFDSDTDDEILKDLEIKEENSVEKTSEKKKEVKTKNKSKVSQKKKRAAKDVGNDKLAKKRKRIIVEDESDSDDIFGSEKSDNDLIEKSDEEPEPKTEVKKSLAPKNKRRKAVEKIYEDEDGYIVTKTEYVYETPSEDENEPENKILKIEEKPLAKIEKKGSSNSENDISPNKGAKSKKGAKKKTPSGNQPTLMNFFKKK